MDPIECKFAFIFFLEMLTWHQWKDTELKAPVTKPDNLCSIPKTHLVEEISAENCSSVSVCIT